MFIRTSLLRSPALLSLLLPPLPNLNLTLWRNSVVRPNAKVAAIKCGGEGLSNWDTSSPPLSALPPSASSSTARCSPPPVPLQMQPLP